MDIHNTYHDLTGVDIDEQRALWDERGKGYYGEYLVFEKLYQVIPGNCKILMNLQIPTSNGKTTEIDLLLIHETGIYVFEIKHYKGTIYGKENDQTWTQYFRTAPNAVFQNPLRQNQYHIDALKNLLADIPLHSMIVFTNEECELRINALEKDISICKLEVLQEFLYQHFRNQSILDMERIDGIFQQLIPYSPISKKMVAIDSEELPFHHYLNHILQAHRDTQHKLETDFQQKEAALNRTYAYKMQYWEEQYKIKQKSAANKSVFWAVVALGFCIVSGIYCYKSIEENKKAADEKVAVAQQELEDFKQKFEHVEPYNNGEISFNAPLVTASDVVLNDSPDVQNAVEFSCTLNWNGTDYGVQFAKDSKIIVILNNGSVQEYDMFNSDLGYAYQKMGKSKWLYQVMKLPIYEFYDVTSADVAYIKITDCKIWKEQANNNQTLFDGYEIELYDANT